MQPCISFQHFFHICFAEIILGKSAVFSVVNYLAGADSVAGLQIIGSKTVCRSFFRCGINHTVTVHIIASHHTYRTFSKTVVRNYRKKRSIYSKICQGKGYIRLASPVSCLKGCCCSDFFIIRRCQTQHDLAESNKFMFHDQYSR